MKRFSIILVTILLVMTMFVSCSVEVNEPETNLMSLRFRTDDDASKALTASRDSFDTTKYVWYYTAEKAESGTPATGTTTEITKVGINGNLSELVGPFSLGKWNFTLYGYISGTTEPDEAKLVYKGTAPNFELKAETTTIEVTVEPQKTTSGTGTLRVEKSIGFTANSETYTATNITVTNVDGTGSYTAISDGTAGYDANYDTFSLAVGSYKVTVAYIKDSITYATNTIYVNVWNGLTTTISGTLDEITIKATFSATENTSDGSISQATNITDNAETTYKFDYSPASNEYSGSSNTLGTTVKGTFKKTDEATGDATLTVKTYDISSANSNSTFVVTADSNEVPVAGIDLTLTNAEFYTDSVAIITTTITKGLTEPKLYHSNSTENMTQVDSVDAVVSNGQWYYNSTDGTLVYATSSFSSFFVSSESDFVETNTNTAYKATMIGKSYTSGEWNFVMLRDTTLKNGVTVYNNGNVTYDLNGKTLSVETSYVAFSVYSNLTVKNGTISGTCENLFKVFNDNAEALCKKKKSTEGSLSLENIKIENLTCGNEATSSPAIYFYEGCADMTLKIKDSQIKVNAIYGISTNATYNSYYSATTKGVKIEIENSTVEVERTSGDDCSGLLVNTPDSVVNITGSTISGQRQGAIFRGGTFIVKNSTFNSNGSTTSYSDYTSGTWEDGNKMPIAALVIGNNSTGYAWSTTVSLNDVTLKTENESAVRKGLYIYQANKADSDTTETDRSVTVSGNLTNESVATMNTAVNGAVVSITQDSTSYVSGLENLKTALQTESGMNNIYLLDDVEISETLDIDLTDKTLNLEDNFIEVASTGNVTFKEGNIISEKGNDDPVLGNYVIASEGTVNFDSITFNQTGLACTILYIDNGKLTITNSTFTCNSRESVVSSDGNSEVKIESSSIFNTGGKGGVSYYKNGELKTKEITPIAVSAWGGTCTVTKSTIGGTGDGANGLYARNATVNVTANSTINGTDDALVIWSYTYYGSDENWHSESTTVTVSDSTIISTSGYGINIAANYTYSKSNLTISNSTVSSGSGKAKVYANTQGYGKVGIVGVEESSVEKVTHSGYESLLSIGALMN